MTNREQLRLDLETLKTITEPAARSALAWELVVRNASLVRFVARKVFFHVDDDALSEASIALHRAMLYVDLDKGGVIKIAIWFRQRALVMKKKTSTSDGIRMQRSHLQ